MQVKSGKFTAKVSTNLPYLLYLPQSYGTEQIKQWPLILFLHGAGERGTDLEGVKTQGIPAKIERGDDLPFIVLAPQCPDFDWWANYTHTLIEMLGHVVENYDVDETRIYLTGLSMGGFGAWHLASEYPERFTAIAPICGFGQGILGYPKRMQRITHIPVWAFHGAADSIVSVEQSRWLVAALREYGGNVEYTEYPGVDHDAWTETYNNPKLYEWFLKHKS